MQEDHDVHPDDDNGRGDSDSPPLDRLLPRIQDKVLAVLRAEFGNVIGHIDVEDLFQDAALKLVDPDVGFEFRSLPEMQRWLITTAKRIGWAAVEGKVKQRLINAMPISAELAGSDTSPSRKVLHADRAKNADDILATLVEELSPPLREVVERNCNGLSTNEIAADLGIKPETVRQRLSEARRQITAALLRLGISRSDVLPT